MIFSLDGNGFSAMLFPIFCTKGYGFCMILAGMRPDRKEKNPHLRHKLCGRMREKGETLCKKSNPGKTFLG